MEMGRKGIIWPYIRSSS